MEPNTSLRSDALEEALKAMVGIAERLLPRFEEYSESDWPTDFRSARDSLEAARALLRRQHVAD